jgi:hypothetical protein
VDTLAGAATITTNFTVIVFVGNVNEAPVHVGPTSIALYENLVAARREVFHVIPMYDDDGDALTFASIGGDTFNVSGADCMYVTPNGEMRVQGFLNYEAGKEVFWMWINVTDSGSLGRLPPLSTTFIINITLLGTLARACVRVCMSGAAYSVRRVRACMCDAVDLPTCQMATTFRCSQATPP